MYNFFSNSIALKKVDNDNEGIKIIEAVYKLWLIGRVIIMLKNLSSK